VKQFSLYNSFRKMVVVTISFALLGVITSCGTSHEKPNIIVILADDLGYKDVGFNGSEEVPTPNIDRLAESGVRCTNAYVSHPYCGPSRAAIITGRYHRRFGHESNPRSYDEVEGLPLSEITIADLIRGQGYATGVIGKWHLGNNKIFHPNRRGFDHFFGFTEGWHYYHLDKSSVDNENHILLERNGEVDLKYQGKRAYLTDVLTFESIDFILQNKDNPFFLYICYNAPHTPFEATEKYLQRVEHINLDASFLEDGNMKEQYIENRRIYAAMVNAMDEGVGSIMKTLEDEGIRDNTLVFFLSDNGGDGRFNLRFLNDQHALNQSLEQPVHYPMAANNLPLRGNKGDVLEGGISVPFVVSWPGVLPEGTDYHGIVSAMDILPTSIALAEGKLPEDRSYNGNNLMPFIKGIVPADTSRDLRWYRFYANNEGGKLNISARRGPWKLYRESIHDSFHLYNLDDDIGEINDLADSYPEIVVEMVRNYEEWIKTHERALWYDYDQNRRDEENVYY
jgi:arylsulfatase A-like enzyme